jgi:hypothetical protein
MKYAITNPIRHTTDMNTAKPPTRAAAIPPPMVAPALAAPEFEASARLALVARPLNTTPTSAINSHSAAPTKNPRRNTLETVGAPRQNRIGRCDSVNAAFYAVTAYDADERGPQKARRMPEPICTVRSVSTTDV